ncbi:uncharacterized protein At5g41620-like [Gastrolobium bilobum]|uniref:uncharacterized protein At5g41620-like n=1 Tax=Gastrolobium bilobum TaxID=150636 RepID=UPI002AAFF26F|nr:uncharacterized protein At5g41620-like [Gastrolobium bilobum]
MERRGKGLLEREKKREGLMVEKLKDGVFVGKRRGPSTPPPIWRLEFPSQQNGYNKNPVQEFLNFPDSTTLSARKLCAKLWEIQPHQLSPLSKTRLRRHRKDTTLEVPKQLDEPPHRPSNQPASPRGLRRHAQASLVQHHRSIERNGCALQPVSPASFSSSMEVSPYNHSVNPISSLDFRRRNGESSFKPKTPRELLKVLNRIWRLEEQHVSNISVVKALKMGLDLSQAQVKELQQKKQMNKQEMENLMKQMTDQKPVRKNKEHDKIKAAVELVKKEIEDERRLRKHSESLHQRLAREISEVKSSFFASLRDLERERKARILLENLCDDFAKGIRDYEHEVRSLMQNAEKSEVKGDSLDKLILHISEAWLDERMQMKLVQAGSDLPERDSIVDKLGVDIEKFLWTKRSVDLRRHGNSSSKELKEIYPCLHSLDSFPPKEAISAPHNMAEEDSISADIFEQKRTADKGLDKFSSRQHSNNIAEVHKEKKGSHHSVRKQVQSKEISEECQLQANVGKNMSCDENESWFVERKSSEIGRDSTSLLNATGVSTVCEATQGPQESDRPWTKRMNSSHRLDNQVGNSSLSSEGDKVYPESICREDSCIHSAATGNVSPVKQWKSTLIVPDFDKSKSSSKLPRGVKDDTLMAKLLEARLEGQKSRSRSRATKSTF